MIDDDTDEASTEVSSTFKSYKLVNFETPKLVPKNHLNFIVAHRFGSVKNGIEDLFGLDIASTRLQFVYGLSDKINLSFSRSKFRRTYDFGAKYHIINQKKNGFPFTIAGHHLLGIDTSLDENLLPGIRFANRLRSTHQLIMASKINDKLSVEFVPTILHDGLVELEEQDNLQYALGFGGRYLFTKRMGIVVDYGLHLNRASTSPYKNVFSIGYEIETGGHVFQLHFSNAQGMYENAFITQAAGDWSKRDFFFGFNINRIFNLKSKK
ncbi:hypothetical protein GCM10011397_02110 [Wenyingzhuangia marina]|nr:hypothetical protein GCM10011397_02110 [Wenyingzhuangia marina]